LVGFARELLSGTETLGQAWDGPELREIVLEARGLWLLLFRARHQDSQEVIS
jgi:hypothetical protein